MNIMEKIVASVLLFVATSAFCESVHLIGRAHYEKLNTEGCELCDKNRLIEARAKWEEVAQWASSRTNDVLRYKSVGNLLLLDWDVLDKCNQVKRETYDLMLQRLSILEQIDNANIPKREWGLTDPQKFVELAIEVRAGLSNVQSRTVSDPEQVFNDNPYYMPIPLGIFRGLGTTVMSPCNIFMSWPASFEVESDIWLGPLPLVGTIFASAYIGKDAVFGLADFCTLGWAGNCHYDGDTSPWWWQRFGGKTKAEIFR